MILHLISFCFIIVYHFGLATILTTHRTTNSSTRGKLFSRLVRFDAFFLSLLFWLLITSLFVVLLIFRTPGLVTLQKRYFFARPHGLLSRPKWILLLGCTDLASRCIKLPQQFLKQKKFIKLVGSAPTSYIIITPIISYYSCIVNVYIVLLRTEDEKKARYQGITIGITTTWGPHQT